MLKNAQTEDFPERTAAKESLFCVASKLHFAYNEATGASAARRQHGIII